MARMQKHWNRNIKYASYPEFTEKYIIIDGQIYYNTAADGDGPVVGRFLRSADDGAGRRGR